MKRILVPTDFSPASQASFAFALSLAARAKAEVFVVHMIELPFLPETTFGVQPYPLDRAAKQKAIEASTRAFEAMKEKFPSGVTVHFHPVDEYVVPGILVFVESKKIDLVVMSTHGASNLQEFFVGATAEKIARFSPVPVLAIPREVKPEAIRNIVFPSTLELNQDHLLCELKSLQHLLDARLHVLLVNTPANFYSEHEAHTLLETFARHYELCHFTLNFRSNRSGRRGIVEFVNEVHGDLIAMATHGRTGLAHFFRGSIAESVSNRIDQPIWTWKLMK
jgi:nucleotide-binding universal stress UspA family protein